MVSPILANIYLDRLDQFVETTLLPAYNRGTARRPNTAYDASMQARQVHRQDGASRRKRPGCASSQRTLPSVDPDDPEYRRLRYVRYADDFLLGFCGPRAEAEAIKRRLGGSCATPSSWNSPRRRP